MASLIIWSRLTPVSSSVFNCMVSVGITAAIAICGSREFLVMAFFISSCCNCRLVWATIRS